MKGQPSGVYRICSFLIGQRAASLVRTRWVNGRLPLLYLTYDSILINSESGARAVATLFVKDAIVFNHLALKIAQERKGYSYVFLEAFVSGVAVNTDAQNLRVALLEFGNISLICLEFFRSTARESQHVKSQYDILLTAEVREFYGLAIRVSKNEIGRSVSDLQMRHGRGGWLRLCASLSTV